MRFYLKKFQADQSACFALLCPDFASIEAGAEMLAFDLHFLLRLELMPAILLCGEKEQKMKSALSVESIFDFQPFDMNSAVSFIQSSQKNEKVPVLVADELELDEALLQMLPQVAKRVHFIRAAGGLKDTDGELLPYVYTHKKNPIESDLEYDYPTLGRTILDACPGVHISLTSPLNLLQEIFTIKGSGTLFRRGSELSHFDGMEQVDRQRLLGLLEASFNKKLIDQSFFESVDQAYIEKEYRGAVLLEKHEAGHYLSKFSVGREAQGEGLALELWHEIEKKHPALFWRSNSQNPFNSWYRSQADGYHLVGQWQIFWRGVPSSSISSIIEYCCSREADFQEG